MNATVVTFPVSRPQARAKEQPFNIHGRLAAILEATNSLLRDGFTILDFQADALSAKPIVYLMPEPRLARMVAADQAVYYRTGQGPQGQYRVGQFDRLGVSVRWIETIDWSRA